MGDLSSAAWESGSGEWYKVEGVCRGRKRLMAGLFCPTTYHRVVMVVPTCGSCVVYLLQKRMRNAEKKEINLLNLESQISSQEARSQESIAKIYTV